MKFGDIVTKGRGDRWMVLGVMPHSGVIPYSLLEIVTDEEDGLDLRFESGRVLATVLKHATLPTGYVDLTHAKSLAPVDDPRYGSA